MGITEVGKTMTHLAVIESENDLPTVEGGECHQPDKRRATNSYPWNRRG